MDDSFLDMLFGSYQCAFTNSCHAFHLFIGIALLLFVPFYKKQRFDLYDNQANRILIK